jgi:Short C-terminal domain
MAMIRRGKGRSGRPGVLSSVVPPSDPVLTRLQQLGELKAQGLLTDAEFDTQKARLLAS